jgi:hypothetical protein
VPWDRQTFIVLRFSQFIKKLHKKLAVEESKKDLKSNLRMINRPQNIDPFRHHIHIKLPTNIIFD